MRDRPDPQLQAFVAEVEAVLREVRLPGSPGSARAAVAGRGWFAPEWPVRWGGAGLTAPQAFLLDRALTEAGMPGPDPDAVNRAGQLLMALGNPDQCERWLPVLATGREKWVLHGSLFGGMPLPREEGGRIATGSTLAWRVSTADRMLALAGAESADELVLVAVELTPAAVTPGLPLDPDRIDLGRLVVEPVGSFRPADVLRTALVAVDHRCARAGRCRSASLRRTLATLADEASGDDALAHRLDALEVSLLALEAMERRAFFPARGSGGSDGPDDALLAAVSIRTAALGSALAAVAIDALGYHALPAPDPRRQHNELPDLMAGAALPGTDAIGDLLRYVGGLDTMGARDRLARLAGRGPHEG